jgi:excinuclease UvrABC nuclease subunit
MREAAERLNFERAIELRDAIAELNRALANKVENDNYTQKLKVLKQKG